MSDVIFFRGENPLRADKLNLAFSEKVQRTGDTMLGRLTMVGDPIAPLEAATKQYVDFNYSLALHGAFLPLTGGIMQGPLSLWADPTAPMHAVTKQYVDIRFEQESGSGGTTVFVSDTPPLVPTQGDLWFDSTNAQLFVRYNDANSNQWVIANTSGSGALATISDTPPALDSGGLWWDSKGGQLYVRYDDGNSAAYVAATNVQGAVNAATKTEVASAQNNSGRNLIHNGLFNIAQRGTGPFTTGPVAITLDRWGISFGTDTASVTQVALTAADRAAIGDEQASVALQNVFTGNAAAGAYSIVFQKIEDVRRLAGKTIVLSFWAKAATGTPKIGLNILQTPGTGGSPTGGGRFANGTPVTISTSWMRYSATFTMPSLTTMTLGSNNDHCTVTEFWLSSGATNNASAGNIGVQSGAINLWGVQLEVAAAGQTQPSPLDKPDPREDLANCQRFYQSGGNARVTAYQTAGNGAAVTQSLPVSMRAIPTISTKNFTSSNISNADLTALDPSTIQIFTGTFTASGTGYVQMNYTASADL